MIKSKSIKKVVLAYSGGLDTSVIIPWIKENYKSEVIAFVANVGQSKNDLNDIKKKAIMLGASKCYVEDLRKEFIKNYIYPLLHSGSIYENNYLLGTAIARPIIAKKQVELAIKINADALCHGSTGKGNDQIRFESVYVSLAPNLKIISPWREWNLKSRIDLLKYLKNKKIKTNYNKKKIYSKDENIFHVSTEGGLLEDVWNSSEKKDIWSLTKDPLESEEKPKYLKIKMLNGYIKSINNKKFSLLKSFKKLNKLGSIHGIGRIDFVENRLVGIKSRGCYETPGGTIISKIVQSIDQLVLDRDCMRWKNVIGSEFSYLIYDGKLFTPFGKILKKNIKFYSKFITGTVLIRLYKGNVVVLKKKSIKSLYSKKFSTFNNSNFSYKHSDADGFIKLFTMPYLVRSIKKNIKLKK
ncbi:argininosuccinate synthase [Buchnera aphidicola (Ceratovacuna keduensis)]|uniref:argininosuccinate synthase n=1 Tax=Buchnera aphidicola TaxID=9 RepID=UPI0031B8A704